MRNAERTPTPIVFSTLVGLLTLAVSGCVPPEQRQGQDDLKAGYQSLEQKQYDQALSSADAFLRRTPQGPGSAEAFYLKGRALEDRVSAGRSPSPQAEWQAARVAYVDALGRSPSRDLDAHIRAGLANIAYFQDDYATALSQWTIAAENLRDPDPKSWALYRSGVCQQRLGRFEDADRTFDAVQKQFPNTNPAQRAAERQGSRGFFVQLATYSAPAGADRAMAEVRAAGVTPQRTTNAKGQHVIRAGPFRTFADAKATKSRLSGKFPDALIVP